LVKQCEQLVELDGRLPAVLKGDAKPADAAEQLAFAQLCYYKRLFGRAARFCEEAFAAKPELADDLQSQNRYSAACYAALAAAGQGKDEPPLDGPARARWRRQALDWLRADLALRAKQLESGKPTARAEVQRTLRHWQRDPDLAGIRDEAKVAQLPEAEREACRRLWSDVEALLERARGPGK
jgi:hypothetical protein